MFKIPAITDVAVRPLHRADGGISIVVYWVADKSADPSPSEITQQLCDFLPLYMIPNRLVKLERIPRTRMGKIAYEELPLLVSTERLPSH